jgi:hypothetical protein
VDPNSAREFVDAAWQRDIVPALERYIAIPCESPAFDPQWQAHHLAGEPRQGARR